MGAQIAGIVCFLAGAFVWFTGLSELAPQVPHIWMVGGMLVAGIGEVRSEIKRLHALLINVHSHKPQASHIAGGKDQRLYFSCQCGKSLSASTSSAGQTTRCPHCGQYICVPPLPPANVPEKT